MDPRVLEKLMADRLFTKCLTPDKAGYIFKILLTTFFLVITKSRFFLMKIFANSLEIYWKIGAKLSLRMYFLFFSKTTTATINRCEKEHGERLHSDPFNMERKYHERLLFDCNAWNRVQFMQKTQFHFWFITFN